MYWEGEKIRREEKGAQKERRRKVGRRVRDEGMKEGKEGSRDGRRRKTGGWDRRGTISGTQGQRVEEGGDVVPEHFLIVRVVGRPPSVLIYLILPTGIEDPEVACSREHLEAGTHSSEMLNKMLKITQQVNECLRF